jgi:valyl-tRNA synthetase
VFIQSLETSISESLTTLKDLILTMTNGKSINFLNGQEQPPIGCGFSTLSDKCKLFILLKGIIDIDKEEAKLTKRKVSLQQQIENVKKEMNVDNYETKVPESVREKNKDKLNQLENEIILIDDGLAQLKEMK